MTATTTPPADRFEKRTCGRCAGSGRYGPASVYAGRCFKCSGRGYLLTKRGSAAAAYLESLRTVRADSLAVGDVIRQNNITFGGTPFSYYAHVIEIRAEANGTLAIVTESKRHPKFGRMQNLLAHCAKVRKGGWSKETSLAQFQQALAFQATLTIKGTPRKVARRTAASPMKCGACARIGTNDTSVRAHSPSCTKGQS